MDEAWLVEANAAVNVALANPESYNEFNSGGIGVDFLTGFVREPFTPPEELAMPACCFEKLFGDKPSPAIVGQQPMEPCYSDPFKRMIGHPALWLSLSQPAQLPSRGLFRRARALYNALAAPHRDVQLRLAATGYRKGRWELRNCPRIARDAVSGATPEAHVNGSACG